MADWKLTSDVRIHRCPSSLEIIVTIHTTILRLFVTRIRAPDSADTTPQKSPIKVVAKTSTIVKSTIRNSTSAWRFEFERRLFFLLDFEEICGGHNGSRGDNGAGAARKNGWSVLRIFCTRVVALWSGFGE
ncbi:hypothetical protein Zmor_005032 [Zophobas morio]|uniref:Uncharacterized protein n=1 Tax=Zophobas morio TaxID=2755281 RepID=A0AA38ML97_9CUCU|nr:hypothetical protein Zmor_005032 [Zophobas morio]